MNEHKFPYKWTLKDAIFTKDKGKVFSCFACGGGSTMGYKLAGFDVLGCNEIDPKMIEAYKVNHNPKYAFLEPIQTFKLRKDLPKELYDLDILDGSPPCSSFSMAGNREKDWGKEKKFREGQAMQVLDTLFFEFIDLAKELQPKIVIAENVEGLLNEIAQPYVSRIYRDLDLAGYTTVHFLLDSSRMGVPQRRKRVFFIALRKDLVKYVSTIDMFGLTPYINLQFFEKRIPFGLINEGIQTHKLTEYKFDIWSKRKIGDKKISETLKRIGLKEKCFGSNYLYDHLVANTLTTKRSDIPFNEPRLISNNEAIKMSTFPLDYNFTTTPIYLCGMSVPPVMTAQIASRIYEQWLSKL